ncbi:MAG: Ig-like domain-containing protein [Tannerella sp.]|nr:Ig-like domain-containing protein [Tannerella sp.]
MKKLFLLMLMALPFVFTSCSDDDDEDNGIKIKNSKIEMVAGDSEQINVTSDLSLSYTSEDEYYATVSSTGVITAKRVGETNIIVTNAEAAAKVSVIVSPKYTTYPDPDFMFGETRSNVIKKHGTPDTETDDAVLYDGYSTKAPIIIYTFDASNKVSGVGVMIGTTYTEELAAFLAERYVMLEGTGNMALVGFDHLDEDKATMGLAVSLYNTSYWTVLYVPYSGTTKKSMKMSMDMDSFKAIADDLLK